VLLEVVITHDAKITRPDDPATIARLFESGGWTQRSNVAGKIKETHGCLDNKTLTNLADLATTSPWTLRKDRPECPPVWDMPGFRDFKVRDKLVLSERMCGGVDLLDDKSSKNLRAMIATLDAAIARH
jgi:hypothetical protein